MVVSDAKTGSDFRQEVLQELAREMESLRNREKRAIRKKDKYAYAVAEQHIGNLKAFFESIYFTNE